MKLSFMAAVVVFALGCNLHEKESVQQEIDGCLQESYNVYKGNYSSYTEWKMAYMDQISFCMDDTGTVIKLAKMDAENEDYTFFIFGLIDDMEPYQTIHLKYPISFHCPSCEVSESGVIYNREMKKYLKQNEGLDYDSIFQTELVKSGKYE